jgi:hypothetical protein
VLSSLIQARPPAGSKAMPLGSPVKPVRLNVSLTLPSASCRQRVTPAKMVISSTSLSVVQKSPVSGRNVTHEGSGEGGLQSEVWTV